MTGPSPEVSDEEFLREMALSPAPVVTISDLQEMFDYSRENIRYRLGRLEEDGFVESMTVGKSAKVFWITDEGRKELRES